MLSRLIIILAGICGGALGAALVVAFALLKPEWSDLMVKPEQPAALVVLGLLTLSLSRAAVVPALVVIAAAEALAIRAGVFYAATGAAIGALVYAQIGVDDLSVLTVGGFARREFEITTAAGIVGGMVYWLVAGRTAGRSTTPPRIMGP